MRDARLQLHWAAQIPAGVGRTLIAQRADDSNTAFAWSAPRAAMMQEPVRGIEAGIRLRDLTLIANDDELPLRGRTLDEGFAFLESHFGATLKRPNVDLPDHAVAHDAKFDPDPHDLATLANHYASAAPILEELHGTPVRCWPHHFDIATLLLLGGEKSVGAGLSPGDDGIRDPYWYVNLWPHPEPSRLPALQLGSWNTAGWTGAVFPAANGAERARQFVREAVEHCRLLLS
jgi:hypothetical protein